MEFALSHPEGKAHRLQQGFPDPDGLQGVPQLRQEHREQGRADAGQGIAQVEGQGQAAGHQAQQLIGFLEGQALIDQLALVKTMGLPNQYLESYTTRVRSVEPDQIQQAAQKYIAPENAAIVVVGDASKIADAVKKLGEVEITKAQ